MLQPQQYGMYCLWPRVSGEKTMMRTMGMKAQWMRWRMRRRRPRRVAGNHFGEERVVVRIGVCLSGSGVAAVVGTGALRSYCWRFESGRQLVVAGGKSGCGDKSPALERSVVIVMIED